MRAMRKRKWWRRPKVFWTLLVVAFVGILTEGIVLSGHDLPPPPESQSVLLGAGGVTAHKMSTKSWSLYYDHAQTSPDGSLAEIDGIHNGIFYREGKPYITISAKHVSVNTLSDDFTATGKVHVEQLKGSVARSFDTDLITWSNASKIVTLSHTILITTGDGTMTVHGATFNVQTGAIHLGNIGGRFNL